MQQSGLHTECGLFLTWLAAVGVVGFIFDHTAWALLFAFAVYFLRFFYYSKQLGEWVYTARLKQKSSEPLPTFWGDIAEDVFFLQNRHSKEKHRLNAVVVRVQEMTSAMLDGVILIDKRDNMEWWNDAAGQLLGLKNADHGHKLINIIRHPEFVQYFEQQAYSQPFSFNSSRRQDQHLQFQIQVFGQGERLVMVRDITHIHKLEQMRKDFVANVSHELRTPLTVLKGYIETLHDSPECPKNWENPLVQMEQQAQRMTLLIQDLIALSKLETDERTALRQPIDLQALLKLVVQDGHQLSQGKHSLQLKAEQPLFIQGSEQELRSAFSNIVYNAINYSPPNATITLTLQRTEGAIEVVIKDQGIGIDQKHLPRLTERFYRVDPSRSVLSGGTGLGLAIVKHVLLRHHGELRINSLLGKGTTVYCVFPQAATL